jgi:flavodoxin
MKTLIIYESIHHGNTEKVAKKIGEILGAELKHPNEVEFDKLKNYDLIGFGSGIYFGRFHVAILKLVKSLPDMAGINAFTFSTHGAKNNGMNKSFISLLAEKSFKMLADFECQGFDTWGPLKLIGGIDKGRPDENDLTEAGKFAENLAINS